MKNLDATSTQTNEELLLEVQNFITNIIGPILHDGGVS